ncbi:hypothetical protein IJE86_03280 [bacterium]|nr:hypothetical protein [bacterium]
MNITSASNFDQSIKTLGQIKGNVTADQLNELTSLFSTQVWNTSDPQGTSATIDRQIAELEALIDQIKAEMEAVYEQQKAANAEMEGLVNDLNEESYQASKQADRNIKEQQDTVTKATDEAYSAYMKGEIEKDEIPLYIANAVAKTNPAGGAKMEAHLSAMDSKGQKITSISNKIANMLDSINEFTAKLKTTETSLDLLKQLKSQIPEHKTREDIQQNIQNPVFTPTQEALGDKLIDKFKTANDGKWADGNEGTAKLKEALTGSGTVDKAKLDAMSPEEKAKAVEDCDLSKYSALELMYMSGMDVNQAGYAIGHIFRGAGIGYAAEEGAEKGKIVVPAGHDATKDIFRELENQYKTLWGGEFERGSMNDKGNKGGADPFSWRDGDTTYTFTVDRDGDGKFDGPEEFLGANGGVDEIKAADTDGDGQLTAAEMDEAGIFIMENDQALTGGGTYGFNGADVMGIDFLDINSFRDIADIHSENLNGNTRKAEFDISINGETVLGKQTENQEAYNDMFYGHTYGEAISFGLDPEEVQKALTEAAQPEDYTADQQAAVDQTVEAAQETIAEDAANMANAAQRLAVGEAEARTINADDFADKEENDENPETATNTTDNTGATTGTTPTTPATTPTSTDPKIIPDA